MFQRLYSPQEISMDAYFILALPRLHPELASLPEGAVTLWPGLLRRPEQDRKSVV